MARGVVVVVKSAKLIKFPKGGIDTSKGITSKAVGFSAAVEYTCDVNTPDAARASDKRSTGETTETYGDKVLT